MEAILNLLRDKNFHLQKFQRLSETELMNFGEDNFDNLEIFYQSRESILDLVRCLDDMVEQAALTPTTEVASDQQKSEMLRLLEQKKVMVQNILAQDLQILSIIESTKSNIIRELRSVQTNRHAVSRYRAPDVAVKLVDEA